MPIWCKPTRCIRPVPKAGLILETKQQHFRFASGRAWRNAWLFARPMPDERAVLNGDVESSIPDSGSILAFPPQVIVSRRASSP
jgi:hypothetical protein